VYKNNYLFDKKKENFFTPYFFRVLKTAVLSRVRVGGGCMSANHATEAAAEASIFRTLQDCLPEFT
jgi:hypothetical protein